MRENTLLSSEDPRFWDWSVDDLARYDVPAMVDAVLATTGHSSLVWIGHSQGNAQAFMAFSQDPALARKISALVALAPVACVGDLPYALFLRRGLTHFIM